MSEAARHPLADLETEQVLLGALLLKPAERIAIARALVKPEDFSEEIHQAICELLYSFDEEGRAVTPTTINAWIKHNPAIDQLNNSKHGAPGTEGLFYLERLMMGVPNIAPVAPLAELIADFALRRRTLAAMQEAEGLICGQGLLAPQPIMPSLELVVKIADEISDQQQSRQVVPEAALQGDILIKAISQQALDQIQFGMRLEGELGDILGGLYPENLVVAGGRPGMGKSVLGENLCREASLQGIPADWWSIEMPSRECSARLICDHEYDEARAQGWKGLHYEDLVKMRASAGQFERAVLSNNRLRELDISVFSEDRVTMSRIAAVTRARVARKPGFRIIVIDHLHILMPDERYAGRRVDELSQITGAAKRLAKRTGACVVLLAQLSRDIEKRDDKRPFMSDFRDSGSIEQDADVVLGLYRGEYYAAAKLRCAKDSDAILKADAEYEACRHVLEIEVLKQRSGETKTAKCFIDIASSAIRAQEPVSRAISELALDRAAN